MIAYRYESSDMAQMIYLFYIPEDNYKTWSQ